MTPSDASIWIALAACFISAYFAACNIALKTLSRARLSEILESRGQEERLDPFVNHKAQLLLMTGTVRTCLGLAVLLVTVHYVEHAYTGVRGVSRFLIAFLVAGIVVSLFNVAIPASVARHLGERLLARSIPLLNFCLALFRPVTVLLGLVDPVIRRLFDAGENDSDDNHLSEEILSVVERHDEGGVVDEGQKEMLEAVVEFPTTTVGQIMTPRTDVHGIEITSTLEQVREAIRQEGHSRIPVYEDSLDHIVGILYVKDLIDLVGTDQPFKLRPLLRHALMVPESKSVRELLAEFKARKVHIAIVLDEYGGTAGLVTIEDIVEEIVGEIHDEYEPTEETPRVRRLSDHSVEVDGRFYIDDLNDELDMDLPEDKDFDTVGGFVFATLGHIPEAGERFEFDGAVFTVAAAERTKVIAVRIDMVQQAQQAAGRIAPDQTEPQQAG